MTVSATVLRTKLEEEEQSSARRLVGRLRGKTPGEVGVAALAARGPEEAPPAADCSDLVLESNL